MRRSRGVVAVALIAAAALVAGVAVWVLRADEGPRDTAERFLAAWERGDLDAMRRLTADPPADFRERFARMRDDLGLVRQRYRVTAIGDPEDGAASGSFRAELTLAGGRVWTYTGTLPFTKRDDAWLVAWSPRVVHPMLREGQRLRAARVWPDRAAVQAADGSDLDAVPSGSVQQIVGSLGKIDAKTARELGPPYRAGDLAGVDGLQRQYEKRLAGTPALAVQIVDADGEAVRTLHRFGGAPGTPLRTTIDPKAQRAASRALADVDKTASLVAVRASTGEILAVANKPGGYNRALMGRYPPGSTFKVVTAAALVADGLSVTSPVACPATTDVGGRTFKNYRHEDFGTVPFREAFAHSCNTTFARLAVDRLGPRRLAQVAEQFGFNAPIIGGLPAVRASFPAVKDDTAFAAASFGQGEVLTSPLNMASVAAAAAGGTRGGPRGGGRGRGGQALDAGGRRPEPAHRLEPKVRTALRTLMPAVVSEGTAKDVDFPPGTAGKTGTAEFGSGENPPTHAWFIGYRGDLAFAVIVEDGGTGAEAAAPIAAAFLRAAA